MIELRPYQQKALDDLIDWFGANQTGNPLVVLPCGAGKSIINAKIIEFALEFPNQRILCLTHVKELLEQNFAAFHGISPQVDKGLYCASLKQKKLHHPVTFASIQSIHKKAVETGFINLVIIDEAHLLSDAETGTYRKFLRALQEINPHLRVIGLTATPWRTSTGLLHRGDGAMFNDIACEVFMADLVRDGYLSPMIAGHAKTQGETSGLHVSKGEFVIKECETVFDEEELTRKAIAEMIEKGSNRKTWLVFCVSIAHAEHVAKALNEQGISCESVSSETPMAQREDVIRRLKDGSLRAATNVAVLTTGTNIPNIDMIAMLRPTLSSGLFLQMAGRGLRLSPGKENCLLLDFAGNLLQHGPITHITAPPQGERITKEKKGKLCPQCEAICPAHAEFCNDCGHVFDKVPRKIKHGDKNVEAAVMIDAPPPDKDFEWYPVRDVVFQRHEKIGSPPSLRVTYKCKQMFSEWICFEHTGYAQGKAMAWWKKRSSLPVPATIDEAMNVIIHDGLDKITTAILVKKTGKFPEIKDYKLEERKRDVAA